MFCNLAHFEIFAKTVEVGPKSTNASTMSDHFRANAKWVGDNVRVC